MVGATLLAPPHPDTSASQCARPVAAHSVKQFATDVWAPSKWRLKDHPSKRVKRAHSRHLKCAKGPGHRKAIKSFWRKEKHAYYRHRKAERNNWCSPTPHPEGGGCWEIPEWCVMAESGGSWTADNPESDARGPYQELGHGGPWPVTSRAEAMAHHRIASSLYAASGLSPWVACS